MPLDERAGDGIGADVGRGRVARAAVGDGQVLAVDAGVDRGRQVGGQVGRGAVGLAVVGDGVAEGVLVDRQRAVVQRHGVVAGQAGAVGERAGDGVAAGVGRGRVARAAVGDVQVLAVDAGGDRADQVGGQVGRVP